MAEILQHFIGGAWTSGTDAFADINPSELSEVVGHFAQAERVQLDKAIDAARDVAALWGRTPIEARANALMAIGRELIARAAELGERLSREEGKPRAEGVCEVARAGQFFTFYAAECHRQYGENAESVRPGVEVDVRREPLGVVAVISPPGISRWPPPAGRSPRRLLTAMPSFGNRPA